MDANQVLQVLTDYCQALRPGDPVPPHRELMRRFDASERAVRGALDELRRQGKIVRRQGARTFVAPASGEQGSRPRPEGMLGVRYAEAGRNGSHAEILSSTQQAESTVCSRTVVAIMEPDGAYFDLALQSLTYQAKADKLDVECRLMPSANTGDFGVPVLSEMGPLGYVLFRQDFDALAERLQSAGHRVVLVGGLSRPNWREVPTIRVDQFFGVMLAIRHLVALGHRSILGYVRHEGVSEAAAEAHEAGIELQHGVLEEDEVEQWARDPEAARRFFSRPGAPTAVLTWNDQFAIRLINLLHRAGLNVPDDVSVVGFDNLPQGRDFHPALTTVDCSVDLQVSLALRLLQQMNPAQPGQVICIEPTLVVRESSAPPRTVLRS
jgi:DNA-binding LacI/PurR family transcriptional regulator